MDNKNKYGVIYHNDKPPFIISNGVFCENLYKIEEQKRDASLSDSTFLARFLSATFGIFIDRGRNKAFGISGIRSVVIGMKDHNKLIKFLFLLITFFFLLVVILVLIFKKNNNVTRPPIEYKRPTDYCFPSCGENSYCLRDPVKNATCACFPGYSYHENKCVQEFCFKGYTLYTNISEDGTYYGPFQNNKLFCCPNDSLTHECCGTTSQNLVLRTKRIIGGFLTNTTYWPWMVRIEKLARKGEDVKFFAGSLISHRHVLTVAHSFISEDSLLIGDVHRNNLRVIANFDNRDGSSEFQSLYERNISKIDIHEEFDMDLNSNDIALLTLDKPIERDFYVDYLCLFNYELEDLIVDKKKLYSAGWGSTSMNLIQILFSKRLRYVDLDVLPIEECFYINSVINKTKMICAGYRPSSNMHKGTCYGDSGGPLMVKLNNQWFQYGIISYGSQYDCGESPSVYTRVAYYYDWVQSKKNS